MDFRDFVKNLIKERGLKAQDIASQTGYSAAFVYDLLKGTRRFNEESEKKFCNCLNIKKTYVEITT